MNVVLLFVGANLFCLKVLWNLLVPYALAIRSYRSRDDTQRGISLMPALDVVLLAGSVLLALASDAAWPFSAAGVLILGGAGLLASYLHLLLAGTIAAWIANELRAKATKHRDR